MSNHLMQRLAIAREDPVIRQAIPQSSFRSQQQAMAEAQMMRAAILAKNITGRAGPGAAAAGAGSGSGSAAAATGAASSGQAAAPRPFMASSGTQRFGAQAPEPARPALPPVFRRAAHDVQITDPASGDILQLDKGTWVLTAPAASAATRTLAIYTTDADTGSVLSYEVPLPEGKISRVFDQHTLNPLDTVTIGE
jgi:hypothetical protein